MKNVGADSFFIVIKLSKNILELSNILSKDQLTYILTKVVTIQIFRRLLNKLRMYYIHLTN